MPTSKKPRKKRRKAPNIERARALTDFLIRPFSAWSDSQYETLTFSMLMPFAALPYEPDDIRHWSDAKGTLVLCWSLLSKSPLRGTVVDANKALQTAYNRHASGSPCTEPLEEALRLVRDLHHFMRDRLSPDAIQSTYNALNGSLYDSVESDLDSYL